LFLVIVFLNVTFLLSLLSKQFQASVGFNIKNHGFQKTRCAEASTDAYTDTVTDTDANPNAGSE